MKQKKLFKDEDDIKEKKPTDNQPEAKTTTTVENTTYHKPYGAKYSPPDPNEIPNTEGYFVTEISYIVQSTLNEKIQGIGVNKEGKTPEGMMGDMYCSGGSYKIPDDLETIKKIFNEFLQEKKGKLKTKYVNMSKLDFDQENFKKINYHFRFIPAKNFFVAIPDKLRDILKERGFDFEKWYEKYQSFEGRKATNKDVKKALEIVELEEKADVIKHQIWGLESIKGKLDYDIKHKNKKARKKGISPCFENLEQDIDEQIQEKVKELSNMVKEIEKIAQNIGISGRTNTYKHTLKKHSQMKLTNMD